MSGQFIHYGIQYAVYFLEATLFLVLLFPRHRSRLSAISFYLVLLFASDAAARPYVLYRYGVASREYAYFYWLTDVLLALAAFLLISALFRRACAREENAWGFLRLLLVSVFVLVLGISLLSLSRNYSNLFTMFIVEFQQNLYFTCLVLNTLLYIFIQKHETADDELSLLVCGLGIQFAGPAANLALVYLTPGQHFASTMMTYVSPMCTLGMLLTWFYAVARMPKKVEVRVPGNRVSGLAVAAGREA